MHMNKMSTDCADLELTILGLRNLQKRKGEKAKCNLGKSVNFLTLYNEIWAYVPGHNTTTKVDVHEYIMRIMR